MKREIPAVRGRLQGAGKRLAGHFSRGCWLTGGVSNGYGWVWMGVYGCLSGNGVWRGLMVGVRREQGRPKMEWMGIHVAVSAASGSK